MGTTEEKMIPATIFRDVLKHFVKQPQLDIIINAPEIFRKKIPENPFGLSNNFWLEIMQCMSSTADEKYTLMLFPDQNIDVHQGFFDYFNKFGGLISDHFTRDEDKIHFEAFYEYVKSSLPLILGSMTIP